jgi:hypothetical protein
VCPVVWSSCVSSAGLAMVVSDSVVYMMVAGIAFLKNELVGKYIASVFDFVSPFPTCISNPIELKILFIISSPLTRSVRLWNKKDPSSRYRMWYVLKAELLRKSRVMLCPVSLAPFVFDMS